MEWVNDEAETIIMKRPSLAMVFAGLTIVCSSALGEVYPHRWVYVARGLHQDQDVDDIRRIVPRNWRCCSSSATNYGN